MFMFGEGGAKRQISGIVFGGGLALFAAQFLACSSEPSKLARHMQVPDAPEYRRVYTARSTGH